MASTTRKVGDLFLKVNYFTGEADSYHQVVYSEEKYHDGSFLSSGENATGYCGLRLCIEELGTRLNIATVGRIELNLAEQSINKQPEYEYFQLLEVDELESLLVELAEQGVFLLQFEGVEPLKIKSLRSILRLSAKNGFISEIHSGLFELPGWLLEQNAIELQIGSIFTSIYSLNNDINDLMVGVKDSLSIVMRNIEILLEAGYQVCVQTPLSKINFMERIELRDRIEKLGAKHQYTWPSDQDSLPRIIDDINIDLSEEEFQLISQETPEFIEIQEILLEHELQGKPPAISIMASGKIYDNRISKHSIGNLVETSLDSIYKQKAIINKMAANRFGDYYPKMVNYRYPVKSRMLDKEILEAILRIGV